MSTCCADWLRSFDQISATGLVGRSDKGELSVFATTWMMASKCLRPMPDMRIGVADLDTRVRQRYLYLIANPEAFQRMLELVPDGAGRRTPMSVAEQIASTERSAASLEKMGRADEAAEMRRTTEKLRQQLQPGDA